MSEKQTPTSPSAIQVQSQQKTTCQLSSSFEAKLDAISDFKKMNKLLTHAILLDLLIVAYAQFVILLYILYIQYIHTLYLSIYPLAV
jgi:hypothetical protein